MILATGVYTYDHLPQALMNRSEDELAEIFVHDIENGIQGTDIKAAFIKCAADEPGVTPDVEKVHRAAARASKQTGRPIMAHSHPKSETGLAQMRLFEEEGVDPAKVQVAHTGDTDDLDYIERLLDTGCWIGMDRYGLDIYLPTEQRQATVARPARAAATPTACSSRRTSCSTTRLVHGSGRGAVEANRGAQLVDDLPFEQVIPELKERGMTEEQLDQMMVENPKRWLA